MLYPPRMRAAQRAHAHEWRARTPPSREPPFHPGNRGSAAARARGLGADGRDLCGTGPGRQRTKVAGLKGSSGSSLGSGDRFGLEGLVLRHGLAESKRGATAPGRVGGRGARDSAAEGEAGPGTWDPPEPTRPDPGAHGLQGPRP